MGNPKGFMMYERRANISRPPMERIKDYNEFHIPLKEEERKCQGARCMDCGVPFCQSGENFGTGYSGCPLHNLIPEWNDMVYRGNYRHALSRLLKTNNFPEFTGRVCPALCEAACTCGLNGDPVTVKDNEYGIIEEAFKKGYIKPVIPKVRTGKKIAVIGSGPAGLAAADQLNKRGHSVTVFERDDRIGGLLMYGIPNMKLEKSVIDRRVNLMKEEGVLFITNADVGRNVDAKDITEEYDAVLICCGAKNARKITGMDKNLNGVYFAVDYLSKTTKSLLDSNFKDNNFYNAKGKDVVIVGGGDTGNDCVGTAIRQGAKSVLQVEMMPRLPYTRDVDKNPWPQWPKVLKTDYGQEEAIDLFGKDPRVFETTVKDVVSDEKGNLKGVTLVKLSFKNGKPEEIKGSETTVKADMLIAAAGFLGCEDYVSKAFGVKLNERTNIETVRGSYKTNVDKVFAAGDARRGQSLVVWAISEARAAAAEVDLFLMDYSNLINEL